MLQSLKNFEDNRQNYHELLSGTSWEEAVMLKVKRECKTLGLTSTRIETRTFIIGINTPRPSAPFLRKQKLCHV
jgi:hypothetical protein